MTAALATTPLTAADRCDRCGAKAYVRVLLNSGGELLFCAHHGREHAPRLREIAAERRRFGYRRLGIMLAREGLIMNHKKLLRLYREENLRVRRRRGRKRAMGTRAPMALPQGPNQRWSLDFVSDTLISGRRIRILAVVDDFTRECLAVVADTSLSGARVARAARTSVRRARRYRTRAVAARRAPCPRPAPVSRPRRRSAR